MSGAAECQRRSLLGLNGLNFFVANMLTGFGPFVTVYLATHGWTSSAIGYALSVGTTAAIVAQVPAGMLVDAVSERRLIAGAAVGALIVAALALGLFTSRVFIFGAEILLGLSGSLLTPSIAAITLMLTRSEALGERLGGNVRFQALGSILAALLMGWIGSRISPDAVFFVAALFGCAALGCLWFISGADMGAAHRRTSHPTALHKRVRKAPLRPRRALWRDPRLLAFAGCAFLFQLANAAALPFALFTVQEHGFRNTDLLVSVAIIVSQATAALLSPLAGRTAQARGRRAILFAGFGALTLRCVLFSIYSGPSGIIAYQALDGVSGAVMGVAVPLVLADITHRGGRFNLALGLTGLAMTAGASVSTALGGLITQQLGAHAAFLFLAAAAGAGGLVVLLALPETAHIPASTQGLEHPQNAA